MRHEPNKAIIFRSENFLQLSPLSTDILRITEEKGEMKIAYFIKVECDEHYYGPECAIYCNPSIGKCRSGWQGSNCNICKVQEGCKHGYCNKANECICEKNWGGTYCDRDLDYCFHNSPCLNGGKCSSGGLQNYYYCTCVSGFIGRNCETKIDPCVNVNCGRFGTCIPSWGSGRGFICQCDAAHYGDHCQFSVHQNNTVQKGAELSKYF
ncbi:unnamed protein product [Gongylonema pulchrum]|uniref:Delta-like protein n=1 Tax=Gongylonema pulchrum TaxID=637853 RepID=A0A183CVQ4_9BILA|nr:unnamed protein product [Gongylonema pulchrum]